MADTVTKLQLVDIGDNMRLDVQAEFDKAADAELVEIVIIGLCADGCRYVSSNVNLGRTALHLLRAQHHLVTGEG